MPSSFWRRRGHPRAGTLQCEGTPDAGRGRRELVFARHRPRRERLGRTGRRRFALEFRLYRGPAERAAQDARGRYVRLQPLRSADRAVHRAAQHAVLQSQFAAQCRDGVGDRDEAPGLLQFELLAEARGARQRVVATGDLRPGMLAFAARDDEHDARCHDQREQRVMDRQAGRPDRPLLFPGVRQGSP